ncbi:hypothetical protein SYNPS1DRAFT_29658 [Syncephalis pseudoplumigaleata]|uniref:Oxidoreductase-like domain-containing protein n=1 Tax=Syncephalis pseudoplumigaleata TaxID=1712513 RepID=A0A4P9YX67_9FUNG|nr:hypothetical protein SYNPS1DRAFT_29658 [Syncephalis pseudoplumigaleata]|eukprot:RKP24584.1 hypothetical protein SYNPS1DRAFT_29658 [Syncephalis pseudoplumigaleata]
MPARRAALRHEPEAARALVDRPHPVPPAIAATNIAPSALGDESLGPPKQDALPAPAPAPAPAVAAAQAQQKVERGDVLPTASMPRPNSHFGALPHVSGRDVDARLGSPPGHRRVPHTVRLVGSTAARSAVARLALVAAGHHDRGSADGAGRGSGSGHADDDNDHPHGRHDHRHAIAHVASPARRHEQREQHEPNSGGGDDATTTAPALAMLSRCRPLSTTSARRLRIRLDDQGNSATVPDKPQPVEPDLCCMSGCARCVWDVYAEELQAYEEGLRGLRAQLARDQQPEPRLLTRLIRELDEGELAPAGGGPSASMHAFMQMEQRIKKEKKQSSSYTSLRLAYAARAVRSSHVLARQAAETAYQLAIRMLREQRERKLAEAQQLEQELQSITGQDAYAQGRRRILQGAIFKLKVQAEKDQPETLERLKQEQYDLAQPVFRHLRRQHWHTVRRNKLMERATQMHVLPDVLPPSTRPDVDVQLAFDGPATMPFVHGDVVSTECTLKPPTVHAQCFHDATRLYTLLLVDPDDPYPEMRTYRTRVHWLVMNIPLDLMTSTIAADAGQTVLPYLPPHPAKGTKKHRYTLILLEQPSSSSSSSAITQAESESGQLTSDSTVSKTDTSSTRAIDEAILARTADLLADRIVDVGGFIHQHQLTPRGLTFFRCEWEPSTDAIYKEHLNMVAPRYGRVPKLDPVRDAAIIARLIA